MAKTRIYTEVVDVDVPDNPVPMSDKIEIAETRRIEREKIKKHTLMLRGTNPQRRIKSIFFRTRLESNMPPEEIERMNQLEEDEERG